MPVDFDVGGDFLQVDDLELVRWHAQSADGEYAEPVQGRGYRQIPKRKPVAMVETVDAVWHLHRPDFGAVTMTQGDILQRVSDSSRWVVQWSDENGYEDQFRVGTTKAV